MRDAYWSPHSEALLGGGSFFTSKVARIVLDGYLRSESTDVDASETLSAREREIVQLLAEGNSNKEVARVLSISVKTAETHRSNIMRKMEIRIPGRNSCVTRSGTKSSSA